jgi:hypothetical protein
VQCIYNYSYVSQTSSHDRELAMTPPLLAIIGQPSLFSNFSIFLPRSERALKTHRKQPDRTEASCWARADGVLRKVGPPSCTLDLVIFGAFLALTHCTHLLLTHLLTYSLIIHWLTFTSVLSVFNSSIIWYRLTIICGMGAVRSECWGEWESCMGVLGDVTMCGSIFVWSAPVGSVTNPPSHCSVHCCCWPGLSGPRGVMASSGQ